MVRRLFVLSGIGLALVFGASCNDDDTVTGPMPTLTATATPPPGAATATPTPPTAPTPTPPAAADRIVDVGRSGGNTFVDQQSGTSTTTISVGTAVEWVWVSGVHSTTSGSCAGACAPDGIWDSGSGTGMTFRRTFNQAGTFPYFCTVHGAMMQGTVVVQ
jgi:plastocyanin